MRHSTEFETSSEDGADFSETDDEKQQAQDLEVLKMRHKCVAEDTKMRLTREDIEDLKMNHWPTMTRHIPRPTSPVASSSRTQPLTRERIAERPWLTDSVVAALEQKEKAARDHRRHMDAISKQLRKQKAKEIKRQREEQQDAAAAGKGRIGGQIQGGRMLIGSVLVRKAPPVRSSKKFEPKTEASRQAEEMKKVNQMCKRMLIQTGRLAFPEQCRRGAVVGADGSRPKRLFAKQLTESAEEMMRKLEEEPANVAQGDTAATADDSGEKVEVARAGSNTDGNEEEITAGLKNLFATTAGEVQAKEEYVTKEVGRFEELKADQERRESADEESDGEAICLRSHFASRPICLGDSDVSETTRILRHMIAVIATTITLKGSRIVRYNNPQRETRLPSRTLSRSKSSFGMLSVVSKALTWKSLFRKASKTTIDPSEPNLYDKAQKELQDRMLMVTRKLQAAELRPSDRGYRVSSSEQRRSFGVHAPRPPTQTTELAESARQASRRRKQAEAARRQEARARATLELQRKEEEDRRVFVTLPSSDAEGSSNDEDSSSEASSSDQASEAPTAVEELQMQLRARARHQSFEGTLSLERLKVPLLRYAVAAIVVIPHAGRDSSLSGMHGLVVLSDRMRAILEEALPEAARYISSPSEGRMREKVQVLDLATNKPDYSLLADLPPPLRNARPVDAGVGVLHARLLQVNADKDLTDSVLVTVNSDNTLKVGRNMNSKTETCR
ncbi:hypothetical protein FOZ62_009124 [Perkinsus olseni]|uniref:Uncharacterized protein n=1 Tax=Perkinsus olseni TaxID=32597 RepID=A0A7J6TIX8_PEROL|nr:hypothetical protein FOZ62_009124 [Perkinsus olseni]